MKTGTVRYAKHYEIAAYGESAVRWGYNHWWSKTFLLGFSADTFNNLGITTKADIACGWGLTEGARSDIRYRNITPKGLSQNKKARINPKSSPCTHSAHALRHPSPQGNPSSYSPSNKALKLCYPLPNHSGHATNTQSFKQRTAWEIASGWDGHLCAAKVKELKSGRADMLCQAPVEGLFKDSTSLLPNLIRFVIKYLSFGFCQRFDYQLVGEEYQFNSLYPRTVITALQEWRNKKCLETRGAPHSRFRSQPEVPFLNYCSVGRCAFGLLFVRNQTHFFNGGLVFIND